MDRFTIKVDEKLVDAQTEHALEALTKVGWVFLGDANKTIPYDTWDMRNSGTVSTDKRRGVVTISYDTPYAVRQHEDTTLRHKTGRRARWLELTGKENRNAYHKLLARLIARKGR